MKMIQVYHKEANQSILVCECDLPSMAEKGWHPKSAKKTVKKTETEEVE